MRKEHVTRNSQIRQTRRWSPLFLGPVVAAFSIGFVWPFIQGIYLSFCEFKLIKDARLSGFGNYLKALQDPTFRHAFWFTALFAIVSLVLINVLAFAVAYALTQGIKGSNLFRTVFFMPNLICGIVLGYIWSMIFDGILGRYGTSIVMDSRFGFWGLIILVGWQQIGYMMIIYIAGLQAVPQDVLEAATVDGANSRQAFFKVTLPLLGPSITTCIFMSLTNGLKVFDIILALTKGGPGSSTYSVTLQIYKEAFQNNNYGLGSAESILYFLVVLILTQIVLKIFSSREVEL